MRAALLAVVLLVWATFVAGSVAMIGYMATASLARRIRPPATPGATTTPSRERIVLRRVLAIGAVVGAIYGLVVGSSFVARGDTASFAFAALPALTFAVLATATSLRLRSP